MDIYILLIIIWILCAIGCTMIANAKNKDMTSWFFIGLFLGVIGLIAVALSAEEPSDLTQKAAKSNAKSPWKCPRCGGLNPYWIEKCECKRDGVVCNTPKLDFVPTEKKCPMCAETVKYEAKICRFCQYKFEDAAIKT